MFFDLIDRNGAKLFGHKARQTFLQGEAQRAYCLFTQPDCSSQD